MAVQTDWSRRAVLCDWLTANGIEPADVPVDGDLLIVDTEQGRAIRVEVLVRTEDGKLALDERGVDVAREVRTVPLTVDPPTWFEPYEKPTREQLLAVVERVRRLHEPTGVVAAAEFGNPPDCAVCGENVWPCPTVRVLDGEEPSGA